MNDSVILFHVLGSYEFLSVLPVRNCWILIFEVEGFEASLGNGPRSIDAIYSVFPSVAGDVGLSGLIAAATGLDIPVPPSPAPFTFTLAL